MILALDAHKLANQERTGTDTVLYYFVKNLNQPAAQEFKKIILYTRNTIDQNITANLPANVTIKKINFPFLWTSLGVSQEMYFHPPDIFFSPAHLLPLYLPAKSSLFIHDIGFLQFPENYTKKDYFYLKESIPRDIKRATVVFVPTEYTKKKIIDTYYADPNRIQVVNLGVDHQLFHGNYSQSDIEQTFQNYDEKITRYPYLFFVGRLDLRKNLLNIIRSFAIFKKLLNTNHILVLAGRPGTGYDQIIQEIETQKLQDNVLITSYLPPEHLPVFYQEAELFLFPSFYEGFGIPILESQASRTPVITSNTSSMPEVAGDSALLVNPDSPDEIAQAIRKIIENRSLANQLVDKGLINSKQYSWEKFTEQTLTILTRLGKKL